MWGLFDEIVCVCVGLMARGYFGHREARKSSLVRPRRKFNVFVREGETRELLLALSLVARLCAKGTERERERERERLLLKWLCSGGRAARRKLGAALDNSRLEHTLSSTLTTPARFPLLRAVRCVMLTIHGALFEEKDSLPSRGCGVLVGDHNKLHMSFACVVEHRTR